MKRFRFSLETLLSYRKLRVDQAQTKLASASLALQAEQQQLRLLVAEAEQLTELLRNVQQQPVTVEELMICNTYSEALKQKITRQHAVVQQAEQYHFECQSQLLAAVKQHKLVNILKEKRLTQYQIQLLAQEQKGLDEIGLQIYVRGEVNKANAK